MTKNSLTVWSRWKITTLPALSPVASSSPSWLNSTHDIISAANQRKNKLFPTLYHALRTKIFPLFKNHNAYDSNARLNQGTFFLRYLVFIFSHELGTILKICINNRMFQKLSEWNIIVAHLLNSIYVWKKFGNCISCLFLAYRVTSQFPQPVFKVTLVEWQWKYFSVSVIVLTIITHVKTFLPGHDSDFGTNKSVDLTRWNDRSRVVINMFRGGCIKFTKVLASLCRKFYALKQYESPFV